MMIIVTILILMLIVNIVILFSFNDILTIAFASVVLIDIMIISIYQDSLSGNIMMTIGKMLVIIMINCHLPPGGRW